MTSDYTLKPRDSLDRQKVAMVFSVANCKSFIIFAKKSADCENLLLSDKKVVDTI